MVTIMMTWGFFSLVNVAFLPQRHAIDIAAYS